MKKDSLIDIDKKHIWHPFTQSSIWLEDDAPVIASGKGFYLFDSNGKKYLDGVSSLWCNVHGHTHERLTKVLQKQAETLCHSTMLGLTHEPIIDLTVELLKILPPSLSRVFYADSGTTAVEAGLRIALEYSQKSNDLTRRKRRRIAALEGAYHGDTLGAVGIGFLDVFHHSLEQAVIKAFTAKPPHLFRFKEGYSEEEACDAAIESLKTLFEKHGEEIAAFIFEPRVQGAAGMWVQPIRYVQAVRELCSAFDILLIADEVATGFLKTGTMFACDTASVVPDIMILAKGLSAGYLPISCAVTTEEIFHAFTGAPSEGKTLFYGQTFAGNPLAAAVAAENLRLIEDESLNLKVVSHIEALDRVLHEYIAPLPFVDEVRKCGLMVAIELTKKEGKREPFLPDEKVGVRIVQEARKNGLIIRPLGNAMVLMPAPAMPSALLEELVITTAQSMSKVLSV